MTAAENRIHYTVLAKKTALAGFLTAELPPQVIRDFEDAVARGRMFADTFNVQIDHTVRKNASAQDLWNICLDHFTPVENPYYPYIFVILDERTARDGTVLLYHDREPWDERKPRDPPEELRVTPATITTFASCLDIHHKTIPDIIVNDRPDDEVETWYYDVPFDHSNIQQNVRLPTSRFAKTERIDGFTELRLDDAAIEIPGFPSVPIRVCWFGTLPAEIMMQRFEEKDGKVFVSFDGTSKPVASDVVLGDVEGDVQG